MRGFSPVRGLFIVVVVYVATLIPPIDGYIAINIVLGLALALVIVAAETRLRAAALTDLLGGVIGFFVGLTIAKTISTALFWADTTNPLVQFMHSLIIVVLPYLGLVVGTRKGEWLEPAKLASLFREARPQKRYRILDTSVIIDGRIADIVETGFLDGTLVVPQFVLKELQYVADSVRRAQAESRAARPRHPAPYPEDGRRRGRHLGRRFPERQGSRSQAHRAGAHDDGPDRHERFQPQQGRAAARRGGPEHQRARQLAEARRPAGRAS